MRGQQTLPYGRGSDWASRSSTSMSHTPQIPSGNYRFRYSSMQMVIGSAITSRYKPILK